MTTPAVRRTRLCLLFNLLTLCVIGGLVAGLGRGTYLNWGPSDTLVLAGIPIDTWARWYAIAGVLCTLSVADTFINEWGMPFISFRIYNPDCTTITDIGPRELQCLANGMYLCSSLKQVVYTLTAVSQIDLALIRVLAAELSSVVTIRQMISEKAFGGEGVPLLARGKP